jgi:hypothetical protein
MCGKMLKCVDLNVVVSHGVMIIVGSEIVGFCVYDNEVNLQVKQSERCNH